VQRPYGNSIPLPSGVEVGNKIARGQSSLRPTHLDLPTLLLQDLGDLAQALVQGLGVRQVKRVDVTIGFLLMSVDAVDCWLRVGEDENPDARPGLLNSPFASADSLLLLLDECDAPINGLDDGIQLRMRG